MECDSQELRDLVSSLITRPQTPPSPSESISVWQLVMEDMKAREQFGRDKYGTVLQVDNGRDHLVDLYQELLDACVYVRAEIAKRKS